MSLKDISFPLSINTSKDNPIDLLFIPALKESCTYDVAVGYFTSNWIRDAAEGIAYFAENNGHARWVVSTKLSYEDWKTITSPKVEDHIEEILSKSIDRIIDALKYQTREMLCWLIADNIVEFKIAIPKNDLSGIFHAKKGIFSDKDNNLVSFNGSYNLTGKANTNWESIDIYTSWEDENRVNISNSEFDEIWYQKDKNLILYEPTEIILDKIHSKRSSGRPYKIKTQNVSTPDDVELRPYQKDAIEGWFNKNGNGMYILATGAGKTITALATIARLIKGIKENNKKIFVLIIVPYKHLLEQWTKECRRFGIQPFQCYGSSNTWHPQLLEAVNSLNGGSRDIVFAISTFPIIQSDTKASFGDCVKLS